MQKCLTIDVGNSRVKYALFQDGLMQANADIDTLDFKTLQKILQEMTPEYVILSSVKHLSMEVEREIESNPSTMILDQTTRLPFENRYQTPASLGNDRIAVVAGAAALFPLQHSLVIDAGTCITYDLLESGKAYLGGNISPGIDMRLDAMHHFTDRLPQVKSTGRLPFVGTTTTSAMQVGAEEGALLEMEGFIVKYRRKFRKLNILLTGGDASFFGKRLKTKIFATPHLVLQGLYEILKYNVQ